jgi:hypothetical protein
MVTGLERRALRGLYERERELRETAEALSRVQAEQIAALQEAAGPLARLPYPISSDERVQWLTRQRKLIEALALAEGCAAPAPEEEK